MVTFVQKFPAYKVSQFSFCFLQLLPDQMSLLNKAQAHFHHPLKNLQSAYKTILVRYIKQNYFC